MKKLMRKLVLSSFALGLAVVTLTTTTFAWYTSNVEVKATDVSGASATSGSSLLMISNDPTAIADKKWDTNIEVNYYNNTNAADHKTPNDLKPLHYVAGSTDVVFANYGVDTAVATNDYIQFDLYFKMSGQMTQTYLYITGLTIENTTEDTNTVQDGLQLPNKDVLMANDAYKYIDSTFGSSDAHPIKSTYNVDIRRALLISAVGTPMTGTAGATAGSPEIKLYNPDGLYADEYADTLDGLTEMTNYDAHKYYNAIMCPLAEATHETTATGCKCLKDVPTTVAEAQYNATDLTASSGKLNPIYVATIPASFDQDTSLQHLKVTFTVFLNGWDFACFDACQGQDIELGLTFGVSSKSDSFVSVV